MRFSCDCGMYSCEIDLMKCMFCVGVIVRCIPEIVKDEFMCLRMREEKNRKEKRNKRTNACETGINY